MVLGAINLYFHDVFSIYGNKKFGYSFIIFYEDYYDV